MGRIELIIYDAVTKQQKACVNKWKFQDAMMGERFITFTITSENPIEWNIGDYCVYRDEMFWLNNIPTVTQKAQLSTVQDGFTYENVKFDSSQEELTRCMMLDVTPTTPEYQAVLGTNYTGSSRFQLYCGETTYNGQTLTPVCALALKIQANLDRLYPGKWHVYVDTESTYTTSSGKVMLATHTDDKMLSFDNTTVAAALAMVNSEFDLDYTIRFRNIRIGYALNELSADDTGEMFVFGYGKGYPSANNQGKGLFQIKQMANSQQKIVTRLRALGSTKNMPYRYYNKKYGGESNPDMSQSLFPTNLQLPGTFLPEGERTDAENAKGSTKWARNNARSEYLRAVKGDTNDSFIDKNDDAEGCKEGIREDSARWDGSNSELPEIYPTIEGVTYGELREAGVEDMDGIAGSLSFQGTSVHPDDERVDSLLAVGYTDNGVLIDDANVGDGINPEETSYDTTVKPAVIGQTKLEYRPSEYGEDLTFEGEEAELFTIKNVSPGKYFMVPTGGSYTSVMFSFRLSSASVSASVGYVIRIKQRTSGSTTVIDEYQSAFVPSTGTDTQEIALPEIPDSKDAPEEHVEGITVTELCDVVVTFTPVVSEMQGGRFTLTYQVGRSLLHPNDDYDPEYNWGPVDGGVAANGSFHVFIKDMGFDLTTTFTGDTPVMAMKSGRCVGREFEIGKNVVPSTVNGVKGYLLTLNRVQDSNLGTYYPSETDPIAAGDYFVFLGISMPDAYIEAAEARLLMAATDYLADNCETKFTYQPSIDDIYLQRQHDNMVKAGTPEKSVYSRLYAGLRFSFHGIPANQTDPLPRIDIAIQQVTITMGEGLTPKVDIVLNDDVQQSTIQRLTTAVDRIYNGSAYASGGGANLGMLYELLLTEGGRMFLSKISDDTANGKITFKDIATFLNLIKAKGGANFGEFTPGWLGSGAHIGTDGRGEFEEVYVRGAIRAAELVFNRIRAEEGEAIRSIGHGEILTVDEENMTATLKLEGDEWATIDVGDICRGLYNTIGKDYTTEDEGEDDNGFRKTKGFFASYFYVAEMLVNERGRCEFRYGLQDGTSEHPCPLMKFAAYGNFDSTKKERQSSMYITAVGIAPRVLFLAGVNDWQIKPYNIKVAIGNIEGLQVYEKTGENEFELKTLYGDAGFFVEDNIYLGGVIQQFISASMDDIMDALGANYNAELLMGSDNIVVDALGNIVDGIYTEYGNGETSRRYKLHTGVTVYDTAKKRYLKIRTDGGELAEDEFRVYYACDGCTVLRDGADFFITSIDHTNDGLSASTLTDSELEIMRRTHECRVNFYIVTANGWQTQVTFPVRITHLDEAYITFTLDNEFDPISYRTQTAKYDGLPAQTRIRAYKGNTQLPLQSVTVHDDDGNPHTADSENQSVSWDWTYDDEGTVINSGLRWTLTSDGTLSLERKSADTAELDLPDFKHQFTINCVAKYAGVLYESGPRVFTVQETTDATLYKLLLSANAILKDEWTYTPGSVDVKLQVYNDQGVNVYTESEVNTSHVCGDVRIRYINGAYNPSGTNQFLDSCPAFNDVATCFTVIAIDGSDVLDVQSVTINAKGHDGAGQAYVETNIDQIIIDCDATGKIEAGVVSPVQLRASLYLGSSKCVLTRLSCYFSYGNAHNIPNVDTTTNEAYRDYTFTAGNALTSGRITIHLEGVDGDNETHTAQKTIAVIANRRGNDGNGDDGQSAFTAWAFIRSISNPTTPYGGSFSSPLPTTPSGWQDGIPAGDAPVWMTTIVFTSDGQYPQPAADANDRLYWAEPKLLTDTYNTDYELTPFDGDPGTPTVPATGAEWYSPGDTLPSGLAWSDMAWMAMRQRIVDMYGTPTWDTNWTVVRIKGEKGDPGSTLEDVTTWYLLSKRSEGITIPVGDPAQSGWVSSFAEPTEAFPFLWRFTRYTYQDEQGQSATIDTALELITKYSAQPNYNLLDDTSFLSGHMDAWLKYYYNSENTSPWGGNSGTMYYSMIQGDDACSDFSFGVNAAQKHNNHNSYMVSARGSASMGDGAFVQILRQNVYKQGVVQKVETGQWYTLSFWHKGAAISSYTMALDANVNTYKDGVQKQALYQETWPASVDWVFHTLTFKAVSAYPDYTLDIRWRMYLTQSAQTAFICMPKLELGQVATEYLASVDEQNPMPLRTVWKEGEQYYQGAVGERYFHLVNYNRQWYRCVLSHISSTTNKPNPASDTLYWRRATNIPFLATGLLLADEGVIDLLYSNKIYTYNSDGQKTASINADQNGAYCIYYPESGNKMMEFSSEGYIYYYNDDDGNTLAWRLGHGGDITQGGSDDWKPVWLYFISNSLTAPALEFTSETTFARVQRWQFISGSDGTYSAHNGEIFTGKPTNNNPESPQPIGITTIPEGWYTAMKAPAGMINKNEGSDEMLYYVVIERISGGVSGSKKVVIRKADGTYVGTEDY